MGRLLGLLGGLALALAAAGGAGAQERAKAAEPPVEVMVLGVWHFANPGQDLNNAKVEDVRSPRRQAELAEVAERLARFAPTKIAIEDQSTADDLTVPDYAGFTPARLLRDRNESIQIGYRLAARLRHTAVYGIDEQPGPGEPDYFPFDKVAAFAGKTGRMPWLGELQAPVQAQIADFERRQPKETMAELLASTNTPGEDAVLHRAGYYQLLKLGNPEEQPGAELNALWYMRNAKIFAKLTQIAKPGDRVVMIFGDGHSYWLRHFVENTPGFQLVEAQPYLQGRKPPVRRK